MTSDEYAALRSEVWSLSDPARLSGSLAELLRSRGVESDWKMNFAASLQNAMWAWTRLVTAELQPPPFLLPIPGGGWTMTVPVGDGFERLSYGDPAAVAITRGLILLPALRSREGLAHLGLDTV